MVEKKKLVNYALFLLITLVALFFIKYFDISYPITVSNVTRSGELAVVGEGKVDVVPDTIYVSAGISVNNLSSAELVQQKIDDVNNKIIAAVKVLGVGASDIKTSGYSIFPAYSYERGSESKITGYNGSATIEIKVKDVKLATGVISEVTRAGANQVQGTRFVVDDPAKYRGEARDKAIANAKDQANKLAKTLGITLGRVVNIVESAQNQSIPATYKADMAAPGLGAGPQLEPGTQTITSTVTLYFEKK